MNRSIFIALIALFVTGIAFGQQKDKSANKEEVIIRKKGGSDEKTTIVINGDQITVNGKPITSYDGENVIIMRKELESAMEPLARAMPRIRIEGFPGDFGEDFNFRFDDQAFAPNAKPQAMLGVVTEKDAKGLKITDISEGSPAEKAGLKKGDLLTKFAGTAVNDPEALRNLVRSRKPDEEVEISYIKAGEKKERKLKATLGTVPMQFQSFSISPSAPRPPRAPRAPQPPAAFGESVPGVPMPPSFGIDHELERMMFSSARPQLGVRIQDTDDGSGVKVLDVNDGSLAASAGIKENDVIVSIDGKRVKDTDEARAALQAASEKTSYPMVLNRQGSVVNVDIKVPKKLKKADL